MENKEKEGLEIKTLKRKLFTTNIKVAMFILILIVEFFVIGAYLVKSDIFKSETNYSKENVLVLNINEQITPEYIENITKNIENVFHKKNVKGLLVVMNSPGGSPTASEEFSEYLKYLEKEKPVYMYIDSIAASGGYYIASAIRPIVSNKNAIVGSIGVIMPHYNLGGLAKKIGIEEDFIAAGEFKKPISYFDKISEKNKKYIISNMIKPTYKNFIADIAKNRGLSIGVVAKFAEGQIFIGNDKRISGILVDKVSHLFEVKNELRNKFGKDIVFNNIMKEKSNPFLPISMSLNLDKLNLDKGLLY